jgi:agmatine/peptidylarginine deiminase
MRATAGRRLPALLFLIPAVALLWPGPALASKPAADPAAGLPSRVRMPAEFENKDAMLLGAAQMVQFHPQALVDIVTALYQNVQVIGLVGFAQEGEQVLTLLDEAGLPAEAVTIVEAPVMTMWARDYGPLTVLDRHGQPYFLDAKYEGRGARLDDDVPQHLAEQMAIPVFSLPLTMEGGDLLSNGEGLVLTTQRLLSRNQEERGYDLEDVWHILQRFFGFTDWIPLPSLQGEPTGHLDMFLTFVDPVTVVVGRYDPDDDPRNAPWLDWIARQLDGRPTPLGPLRVERMPMPPNGDGVWRTYTNVIFANEVLLVPAYPTKHPDLDREAVAIYQRLLPDWRIVSVDATSLIRRNGALHCVTLDLPDVQSLM